jgi:hypothetical protein
MPKSQNYAQNLKSQAYLHLDSQIISNSFYHGTPLLLRVWHHPPLKQEISPAYLCEGVIKCCKFQPTQGALISDAVITQTYKSVVS